MNNSKCSNKYKHSPIIRPLHKEVVSEIADWCIEPTLVHEHVICLSTAINNMMAQQIKRIRCLMNGGNLDAMKDEYMFTNRVNHFIFFLAGVRAQLTLNPDDNIENYINCEEIRCIARHLACEGFDVECLLECVGICRPQKECPDDNNVIINPPDTITSPCTPIFSVNPDIQSLNLDASGSEIGSIILTVSDIVCCPFPSFILKKLTRVIYDGTEIAVEYLPFLTFTITPNILANDYVFQAPSVQLDIVFNSIDTKSHTLMLLFEVVGCNGGYVATTAVDINSEEVIIPPNPPVEILNCGVSQIGFIGPNIETIELGCSAGEVIVAFDMYVTKDPILLIDSITNLILMNSKYSNGLTSYVGTNADNLNSATLSDVFGVAGMGILVAQSTNPSIKVRVSNSNWWYKPFCFNRNNTTCGNTPIDNGMGTYYFEFKKNDGTYYKVEQGTRTLENTTQEYPHWVWFGNDAIIIDVPANGDIYISAYSGDLGDPTVTRGHYLGAFTYTPGATIESRSANGSGLAGITEGVTSFTQYSEANSRNVNVVNYANNNPAEPFVRSKIKVTGVIGQKLVIIVGADHKASGPTRDNFVLATDIQPSPADPPIITVNVNQTGWIID